MKFSELFNRINFNILNYEVEIVLVCILIAVVGVIVYVVRRRGGSSW